MAVRVDEAPFEKVTNVVVEQDVVGRIFGFGDVRFDTDGTAFKGVKNPVEVKRRLKKQHARRMEGILPLLEEIPSEESCGFKGFSSPIILHFGPGHGGPASAVRSTGPAAAFSYCSSTGHTTP